MNERKTGSLHIFTEMPAQMKIKIRENARCEARIKEEIIASAKDSRIFLDAIAKPRRPSDTLEKAFDDYVVFNNNLRVKLKI